MHGDCSIRVSGPGFSAEEIAACAASEGLLSIEIELSSNSRCDCGSCNCQAMSLDELRGLLTQAKGIGCRRCLLVDRGSPSLEEIVADAASLGMQIELISVDAEISSKRATFLREHDVAVAIDYRDPAIEKLRAEGYGDSGPMLAIRAEVLSENIDSLPALWRSIRTSGFEPHVQVAKPRPWEIISPTRIRELFETLGRIDREEFGREWSSSPSTIGRTCNRHLYACHVAACGTIYACVGVTIPLGTIRTETLREILSLSEVLENLRAFEQKVKEPCRSCCKTVECYGCRGSAYQLTGDYLAGDAMCWKADRVAIDSLPVPINGLIPHGESIRMAHQLVQVGEREATTKFIVPLDSFLVDETGRLDESAYIEMIAQSFAASHGFHLSQDERAMHRGLLLGVKEMQVTGEAFGGDVLKIHVRKVTRFGDFGIIDGAIRHQDGRLIATGTVKVWKPSDEAAAKAVIA